MPVLLFLHRPGKIRLHTRFWAVCLLFLLCTASGCATRPTGASGTGKAVLLCARGAEMCQEIGSGRMWQVARGGPFSAGEAGEYVANLRLGGYDDWRLPTTEESLTLLQLYFWEQNGNCRMNRQGDFWSGAGNGQVSLGHWEDDLLCGPEFKYVKSLKTKGYVRAIRP